jgi:hypothetical protein
VALEGSRDLTKAETNKFYWIETLENYLRTDIESGEGIILPGGDSTTPPLVSVFIPHLVVPPYINFIGAGPLIKE